MSLSRRHFLFWSFAAGMLGQSRRLLAAPVSPTSPYLQRLDTAQSRCLHIWIDTLLPADEASPAASELGVTSQVTVKALGNTNYLKLIQAGCRWLDQQARNSGGEAFATLDVDDRERVARLAEQATAKSMPRMFFEHTRQDAFHFYYAQPETWVMLDYPGPPQPRGFMDYSKPPAG
jgi:hypothetical protein